MWTLTVQHYQLVHRYKCLNITHNNSSSSLFELHIYVYTHLYCIPADNLIYWESSWMIAIDWEIDWYNWWFDFYAMYSQEWECTLAAWQFQEQSTNIISNCQWCTAWCHHCYIFIWHGVYHQELYTRALKLQSKMESNTHPKNINHYLLGLDNHIQVFECNTYHKLHGWHQVLGPSETAWCHLLLWWVWC